MLPIVIIGSGLGGYSVAREFRKLDKQTPLVIVSADSACFYSKPTLSNALAAGKTPAAIPLNSAGQMAAQLGAVVRDNTRVVAIDTTRHSVDIGGDALSYSKLVLALGADQIRVPIAGNGADRVLTINHLDDYATFRTEIEGKSRIAIIGAGLIGCEFANDLAGTGYKVDIIDIAPQPLGRLLPPEGGAVMRRCLEALGIAWHLGTSVNTIDGDPRGLHMTLANEHAIDVDVVLSAVGLKPRLALAQAAGLKINRGIVADRHLETSAADVYALGDCVEVAGLVLPFVMPIMHSARALAAVLAGKPAALTYPAMPVIVKTPACPAVVSPPSAGAAGEWQVATNAEGVKALFRDGAGKLLGFALLGNATSERAALTQQLPPVLA